MYESQALHPGDTTKNTEEWPMLKLTDVSVVRFRRGRPEELVDLYDIMESGPFRVRGILEPVPKRHKKIGMGKGLDNMFLPQAHRAHAWTK
jgi:hypothetical protein